MKIALALDGALISSRKDFYDQISAGLNFPEYFGRNLDALYDLLCEADASVTLLHAEALRESLGAYAERVIKTFRDAAEKNPNFTFALAEETV